jgi:hypothetical protein
MEIRCSNCGFDCGGKCVDFDQLIKDGKTVEALQYFAKEGYENGNFGNTRKKLIEHAALLITEHEGLDYENERNKKLSNDRARRITEQQDKIRNLTLENANLKKGISKSSLDILNGNSDVLYNVKHSTEILDAFNNIVLGLFKLSDEEHVFNTINVNTDTIDQYKNIKNEIGMELNELAGKIGIMRNLIFAEVIDWHKMSDYIIDRMEESE